MLLQLEATSDMFFLSFKSHNLKPWVKFCLRANQSTQFHFLGLRVSTPRGFYRRRVDRRGRHLHRRPPEPRARRGVRSGRPHRAVRQQRHVRLGLRRVDGQATLSRSN